MRTAQGTLWSKVMSMDRYVFPTKTPHVEYFVGGNYSTFSATIAPAEGFGTETEYYLEVYGDNDNLLATSNYIDYKTSPFEFSVDISGQQYVKLVLCKESERISTGKQEPTAIYISITHNSNNNTLRPLTGGALPFCNSIYIQL